MTLEEYKTELNTRMKALSWQERESFAARLKSPAHELMVKASRDPALSLEAFEALSCIFYEW